ncbi:MAG: NAD(P)-binding domain-containing protein [Planctomycetes bacterium]|nr:NAD(P)-binding domain-containing protein [Planctomycetota bacterium]
MGSRSNSLGAPQRLDRIAIIGAGPIGLEAALAAAQAGLAFDVYEAGRVGDSMQDWGHVTLFTPFSMNHSQAGAQAILAERLNDPLPSGDALMTGADYVERYLLPLSRTRFLHGRIHTGRRVIGVARKGLLKQEAVGDPHRGGSPFLLFLDTDSQGERLVEADVVIDASGLYRQPNRLGPSGLLAIGERAAGAFVRYGLDDVTGKHREPYVGKRIALIGAGYSAATSVVALRALVDEHPETHVVWLTRRDSHRPIREIEEDRLPARHALAKQANAIARESHPRLRHLRGTWVERLEPTPGSTVVVHSVDVAGHRNRFEVDRVLAQVGYRPDRSLYEELQVHECYATQAPMKLAAALLSQAAADCLDRMPTPSDTLCNPEPNFFILGAKSYGRDSSFLIRTGLAQVKQVFTLLADKRSVMPAEATGTG